MTKRKQSAFVKRLAAIRVEVIDLDVDSVTILGSDYGKVLTLANGGRFLTTPVGTDRIRLR